MLQRLDCRPSGLTTVEADHRRSGFGDNVLSVHRVTAAGVLLRQLRNPLLILLLAAAGVSGATGDPTDALIIAAIVFLSVGLGFVNEYRSERAVAALHANIHHHSLVERDNTPQRIDVRTIVPGDVLTLQVGDIVPADVRLIETTGLECDEAVLTGESMPVVKSISPTPPGGADLGLASCAFMGTIVHQGMGRGVVVAIGSATAFGKIAVGLDTAPAYTAFQVGLKNFSKLLVWVAGLLTVSIFVINVAFSRPIIDALLFSLAIAIGITPQLLPAIVSVSLAAGSRELARRKVLVKRLVTIEDLGNVRVLFTDKTGTLTAGTISFAAALDPGGTDAAEPLTLGLVCNEATLVDGVPVGGNPLDQALWTAPAAAPLLADSAGPASYVRIGSLPFDHDRQLASVTARTPSGSVLVITKGAPEAVLARCVETPVGAAAVLERLFGEGLRVVALATRQGAEAHAPTLDDERGLRLAGFLTFSDPPKPEAAAAIAKLHGLGVDVKIITGDNGAVAAKVCGDIGLDVTGVLTGAQVDALDEPALIAAIATTTVFARVTPEQKSRVVSVARKGGDDVAFLGDGVNDAVALHAADVGISVDSGTDVAKDAADIILLDKDLGVLADGVLEGRRIFANTMKYVLMATSSNFGNMFSAAGVSLFLSFLPMLPSQILLNNLLYDVGQLAIPTDDVDAETVARPAAWDIGFVRRFMIVFGPVSSIFDFLTFFVMIQVLHAGQDEFRTGWFVESLATQTLVVFLIRTRRVPFFRSRPSRAMVVTPLTMALVGAVLPFTPIAHVLGFAALPITFFLILAAMVIGYLGLIELAKSRFYAHERSRPIHPHSRQEDRNRRGLRRRAKSFIGHGAV